MFWSSTGAPVVTIVVFANFSFPAAALTTSADCPSTLIEALPGRRTIIWACRSSGKFARRGVRILPWLSWRRTSRYAGLSSVRWATGTAVSRCRVTAASALRLAASSGVAARAVAARRILPATLSAGLLVGLVTSASLNRSAVSGLTTFFTLPLAFSSLATDSHWAIFSGVKSSFTV